MKGRRWIKALLMQMLLYALAVTASVLVTLFVPSSATGIAFRLLNWAVLPLLGGVSSYRATRKGVYYLGAWIAPPVLLPAVYWGMTGLPPSHAMMVILCALLSIIGAAAGHEMNKRKEP